MEGLYQMRLLCIFGVFDYFLSENGKKISQRCAPKRLTAANHQFNSVVLFTHYNLKPVGKVFSSSFVMFVSSFRHFHCYSYHCRFLLSFFLQKLTVFCTKRFAHPVECHAQFKTADHNCLIVPLSALWNLHQ